jgi:hypothetical protein
MLSDVVECVQRHFLTNFLGFEGLKRSDSAEVVQVFGPVMKIIEDKLKGVVWLDAEGGPVRDQIGILVNFAENDPRQEVTQPPENNGSNRSKVCVSRLSPVKIDQR